MIRILICLLLCLMPLCGWTATALDRAVISEYAINLDTGRVLLARHENQLMQSGSTLKIVTALHAAQTFRPDATLRTTAYASAPIQNGVLKGNLTVVFVGDPSLTSDSLQQLAHHIRAAGIQRIQGNLIINIGRYTGHDHANGWNWSDQSVCFASQNTVAQVNENCVVGQLYVHRHRVRFQSKDPYLKVTTRVTLNKDPNALCELNALQPYRLSLTLEGCITRPVQPLKLAVPDGNLYTATVLSHALQAAGVHFHRMMFSTSPTHHGKVVAFITGQDMQTLWQTMLHRSDNHIAEQLFRNIAYQRTQQPVNYKIAAHEIGQMNQALGLQIAQTDGSGMSAHDRISAKDLVTVMRLIATQYPTLLQAFPHQNEGTLAYHKGLQDFDVIGKTGSVFGAHTFVGILFTPDHQRIAFAYMINNLVNNDKTVKNKDILAQFEHQLLEQLTRLARRTGAQ